MSGITYRKEIDGLRAIAIISVVTYHFFDIPSNGFVGVDIFFVISGYIITAILNNEYESNERIELGAFYARRIRRLLPALLVVIFTTVLISYHFLYTTQEKTAVSYSAIASLFFVANLYFQENTGGYFDAAIKEMPLQHMWSLGVEEQFYIIWPLLLIALFSRANQAQKRIKVIALFAIFSFVICEALIFLSPQIAFYQMPSRFWELAAGALIALTPKRTISYADKICLLGLLILSTAIISSHEHFPGLGAIPAVLGSTLVIYSIHNSNNLGQMGKILRSKPMVFMGLISYSLYLWHWPLIAITNATRVNEPLWHEPILLLLTALLLSYLSYRFIEIPFRRNQIFSKASIIRIGLLSSTLLGAVIFYITPEKSLDFFERDTYRITCNPTVHIKSPVLPPNSCNSIPNQEPTIILWGDSHAFAWKTFAYKLGEERNVSVASFTYGGCPPTLVFSEKDDACISFNEQVINRIKKGDIETVIISARWLPYFQQMPKIYQGKMKRLSNKAHTLRLQDFKSGMLSAITEIRPYVKEIIILGPLPQMKAPASRCKQRDSICAMPRNEFDILKEKPDQFLNELNQKFETINLDFTSLFCNNTHCPPTLQGSELYYDTHHINSFSAEKAFDVWFKTRMI